MPPKRRHVVHADVAPQSNKFPPQTSPLKPKHNVTFAVGVTQTACAKPSENNSSSQKVLVLTYEVKI
jgi:hypothetical protein